MRFFFKGLPEDGRLEAHSVKASAGLAKGTLYEAWFRALQMSPYLAAGIDQGEWRSRRVAATHEEFGDLRGLVFEDWWVERGHLLFAESRGYVPVTVAREWHVPSLEAQEPRDDILHIAVPLTLSPSMLKKQFDAILREHHPQYTNYDRWATSTARMPLQKRKLTDEAVNQYLDVYELWLKRPQPSTAQTRDPSLDRGRRLYAIGEALKLVPAYMPRRGDDGGVLLTKQAAMSQAVSAQLAKARRIIAHASEGCFPCTDDHPWVDDAE